MSVDYLQNIDYVNPKPDITQYSSFHFLFHYPHITLIGNIDCSSYGDLGAQSCQGGLRKSCLALNLKLNPRIPNTSQFLGWRVCSVVHDFLHPQLTRASLRLYLRFFVRGLGFFLKMETSFRGLSGQGSI